MQTILDIRPTTNVPLEVIDVIAFVLSRTSRLGLQEVVPSVIFRGNTAIKVNTDKFAKLIDEGVKQHAELLEDLRHQRKTRPTPEEWVRVSFRMFDIPLNSEQVVMMTKGLEAAIAHNDFLCQQAQAKSKKPYDFHNSSHRGDWVDLHQVMYLADPTMHLLTGDKPIFERIKHTEQSKRIYRWNDFI